MKALLFSYAAAVGRIYNDMLFDCHNDVLTSELTLEAKIAAIRGYKSVGRVVCALWTSGGEGVEIAEKAKAALDFDFAVEDLGAFTESDLSRAIRLKPLYCGLTWNYDNSLAGGALGRGGLTSTGGRYVQTLESHGVRIDTAHLNERSFREVASAAEKIFCSHASLYELAPYPRNLKPYQVNEILSRGGVVALTPITKFNSLSFPETIDYFVEKYGLRGVAIGSDFYGSTDFPKDLKSYSDFARVRASLMDRGYSASDVDDVFYRNAARFFDEREE